LADKSQAAGLNKWLTNSNADHKDKVTAVTELYNQLQIRHYAEEAMQTYADKAFTALDAINLPDDHKQYLRDFADGLMVREN
jgi:geranylgeranyl diphosphate synthase type II